MKRAQFTLRYLTPNGKNIRIHSTRFADLHKQALIAIQGDQIQPGYGPDIYLTAGKSIIRHWYISWLDGIAQVVR